MLYKIVVSLINCNDFQLQTLQFNTFIEKVSKKCRATLCSSIFLY